MRIELLKLIVTFVGPFATHVLALPEFGSQDTTRSGGQSRSASRFEARARDGLLSDVTAIIKGNPAVEGLLQNATAILYAIPTTFNLSPLISKGRKVIPDAHHPFIAPGPTDARGGCPGLNLMANYGYIPRNGITDMVTLLYAIQEVFGVGPDFALVLVALALKTSVDLTTLKMSIGDTDARTDGPLTFLLGRAPGLFSTETHNKYEVDGSLATDDAYFAGGRTTQFNGTRWATWYKLAETKYNGTMPIAWNGDVRFMQYNLCRKTNPKCHWAVVDQLVFYLAQTFISTVVPSSEANGLPGPALVDSVNQFMGIVKHPNGTFTRDGHSRLPPGRDGLWYRRTIPLTTLEMAGAGGHSLTSHLPEFGHNDGLGNWNADLTHVPNIVAPEIACLLTKSILDPKGTRFKGVALTALTTLLRFVLAPVQGQLSCK